MTLNYIAYGFSRFIICIFMGIILGSILNLLGIDFILALIIALFFVNLLLIYYGYCFTKNALKNKYKQSLLLSIIISFVPSFFLYFFKEFEFVFKSFFNILICINIGILIYYLKFDFKKNYIN